ncbi:MAG: succinate dehydrogenase, partial [Candidatus Marinimicrobia bacterium]|nr:succinate dehydrogenase [Candidatus Neomarinimicrobiota bacterium]
MKTYFTSTIFRKTIASLSGVFLVLFLLGHLLGNLQLFISGEAGQKQFNEYAFFMTTNPVVKILSLVTYTSIILHIALTFYLTIQSRNARPVKYA